MINFTRKEFLTRLGLAVAALGIPGFIKTKSAAASASSPVSTEKPISREIQVEWLGHGSFKFVSKTGKVILLDPWLSTNPKAPSRYRNFDGFEKVDLILFTHGHVDHFMLSDVQKLITRYEPDIIAPWELDFFIKSKIPLAKCMTFQLANIGAAFNYQGITISMVNAVHSSGAQLTGFTGVNKYMGRPVGYVLKFENGLTIYHSGDTALMSDMKLVIGDFYKPDVAILPIGNVFTMGPEEAAFACQMIQPSLVIPEHYSTFPVLEQNADTFVANLKQRCPDTRPLVLTPGKPVMV